MVAGYGGVFKRSIGEIIYTFVDNLGQDTTSSIELWDLYQSLLFACQLPFL